MLIVHRLYRLSILLCEVIIKEKEYNKYSIDYTLFNERTHGPPDENQFSLRS